MTSALLKK